MNSSKKIKKGQIEDFISDSAQLELNKRILNTAIVDALTSTNGAVPLSANQGRVLKGLIETINGVLQSNDGTLDELQEVVNYIKANRSDLQNLSISNIAGLTDALAGKLATGGYTGTAQDLKDLIEGFVIKVVDTTTYTVLESDRNKLLYFTASSFDPILISIPETIFDNGVFEINGMSAFNTLKFDEATGNLALQETYGKAKQVVAFGRFSIVGGILTGDLLEEAEISNGSELQLSDVNGRLYDYDLPRWDTVYTTTSHIVNGYASVLINAPSEPTVTGATKIKGATFKPDTNMEMIVEYKGPDVGVRYFFLEI